jgi:predicted peptidase
MKALLNRVFYLLAAGLLAGLLVGSLRNHAPPKKSARLPQRTARAVVTTNLVIGQAGYRYLCYLPDGPGQPAGPVVRQPLILFLHGACPDENLEKFKHFGPISYALCHEGFPFIAVCPASSQGWTLAKLDQLLDHIQSQYPVDPDRIYLTGYSNGGHATWMMALAFPRRFAAIAPVAGAGDPLEASRRLWHLPVWIFHGVKDRVIPVAYGRRMAEALRKEGAPVQTTFYEDRGHDTWGPPYWNPELYDWFLDQKRM